MLIGYSFPFLIKQILLLIYENMDVPQHQPWFSHGRIVKTVWPRCYGPCTIALWANRSNMPWRRIRRSHRKVISRREIMLVQSDNTWRSADSNHTRIRWQHCIVQLDFSWGSFGACYNRETKLNKVKFPFKILYLKILYQLEPHTPKHCLLQWKLTFTSLTP